MVIHHQKSVDNWLDAIALLPSGSLCKATSVQPLGEIKAVNKSVTTMLRYVNDGIQGVNPDDTDAIRRLRAIDWFNRFIDWTFLEGETAGVPHWQAVDIIGFWNEYYAGSQLPEEKELWWRQERVAAQVWQDEYRNGPNADKLGHIRLAIGAAPVGNDIPMQSAETAYLYDCILDYHGYDKYLALKNRDPYSWPYHCGRWEEMDRTFMAAGYFVDWLLGESGPYAGVLDGWRSGKVLGGDRVAYVESARVFVEEVQATDAYKTGRFKGFVLFTTGGGSTWKEYETGRDELVAMANMLVEEQWGMQVPMPIPVPPTPVPPVEPSVYPLLTLARGTYLNVRSGPGIEYRIVGRIGWDTRLHPTDRVYHNSGNVWVQWGSLGWSAQLHRGVTYLVEFGKADLSGDE